MKLIDVDNVKDFFFSETSGTEDVIRDLMDTHGLDYANDINEDVIMAFAKDLLKAAQNVIDTEMIAYDVDAVVEQLDEYITKIVGRKSALYQTVMQIVKGGGLDA